MFQGTDIVIPIFNEEEAVPELLSRLRSACPGAHLIFVDNASTDRTCERLAAEPDLELIRHEQNLGYGRSLLDGMRAARGEKLVVIDADLEYLPEDIPALLQGLATAPVVYGSRFLGLKERPAAMQWHRALGNRLVTGLFNRLFGQALTDLYTGIRGFRRDVLPLDSPLSPGFEFVLEISAYLAHAGHRLDEVPAGYAPRRSGRSKMRHIPEFAKFVRRLIRLRWQLR